MAPRVCVEAVRAQSGALTTPNAPYNPASKRWRPARSATPTIASSGRGEFQAWDERVAAAHGYQVTVAPVGPEESEGGAPSQLALLQWRDRAGRTDHAHTAI